jgi:hypothetical protein
MNGDNGYKKTIGKHSTSNCSLRFKLYVGSYIYVKNDLQFETNGVADGASHTNTRIINSSVVWLYGRTHPWTFVGRPSDHGCIAIIIDAGQNFFSEYVALRRIKMVCYNAGQPGARTRSYNTRGLYGKTNNLNSYRDNH